MSVARPPFDALWHGLDLAAWLVDANTLKILQANEAAARLVGRGVADMRGMPVLELAATPEDQIYWSQPHADVAAGIQSHTWVRNQGSRALVPVDRRVLAMPAPAGAGTVQCLLLTMRDRSEHEASRLELEALLSELRATLDSAVDGVLTCNLHGQIRAFNHSLVEIWHLPHELLLKRDDAAIWAHLEGQVLDLAGYRAVQAEIAREPMHESSCVLQLRHGVMVEQRCVPQLVQGRPAGRVYTFRDITESSRVQADLRLAAKVFESSLDATFIADKRSNIVRINPACEQLLGTAAHGVVGHPVTKLFAERRSSRTFMSEVGHDWAQQGFWEGELRLRRREGGNCTVQLSWVVVRDAEGGEVQSIGFMRDLTQQHAAKQRIEQLAYRDALTGLPNGLLLGERVGAAIEASRIEGDSFAILFLDLDRFKIVNDSLGHPFGDRVLKLVADRLQGCLRQADMLCRLGGDEFVIYLHGASTGIAEAVARRMIDEMQRPFMLDGIGFSIQCSIGVSMFPQDGESLDDLIKQADTAMYRVKERGRGNFGFYEPQMNANLLSRMKLEHALRQALGLGHMTVHYQPQVDMATGRIVGAEALARWTDPEFGVVSPGSFIPLAEESGFIVNLGAWVMEQAIKEAAHWLSCGMPLVVSVNVSALEFRQVGFVDRITGLLARYGLPARLLELELTESVLLNDAQEMEQVLAALTSLGLQLSIDDFGTGYSSLAYLKKLAIHRLKIDRTFVSGLPGDEGDGAIVRAVLSMGRALGFSVVAEGVETQEQRSALQNMGCEFYQGYLCSPALPAAEFRTRAGVPALEQKRMAKRMPCRSRATKR
ncbi:MAG: EAL domain-containing protein [Proteobacteria bacterium]|nr:EAL domain-containing protein [Pseudomonadota bacterium]MBS0495378.1 EAL domain-containing protein [Pseudomonadota bacterium]